jgi:hypothetical protein
VSSDMVGQRQSSWGDEFLTEWTFGANNIDHTARISDMSSKSKDTRCGHTLDRNKHSRSIDAS